MQWCDQRSHTQLAVVSWPAALQTPRVCREGRGWQKCCAGQSSGGQRGKLECLALTKLGAGRSQLQTAGPAHGDPDRHQLPRTQQSLEAYGCSLLLCTCQAPPSRAPGMGDEVVMVMRLGMPSLGSPREPLPVILHTGRHGHADLHTQIHTCTYTRAHTHVQTCTHNCTHKLHKLHTYAHTELHTHAQKTAHTQNCTHTHADKSLQAYIYLAHAHTGLYTPS
jgi:hypothetical protein